MRFKQSVFKIGLSSWTIMMIFSLIKTHIRISSHRSILRGLQLLGVHIWPYTTGDDESWQLKAKAELQYKWRGNILWLLRDVTLPLLFVTSILRMYVLWILQEKNYLHVIHSYHNYKKDLPESGKRACMVKELEKLRDDKEM